ncbi:MAG TPA: S8 family serine peptidase [Acidimicrobiales bacterium]|jgi:serine protease AprX|nr:S8 family serine peptidase [Acidimicrobiales bacterium]
MTRTRLLAVLLALVGLVAGSPAVPVTAAPAKAVIVVGVDGHDTSRAVERAGGEVERVLDVVGGVAATLTERAVRAVEDAGYDVVSDVPARVTSTGFDKQGRLVQLAALNPSSSNRTVGAGVGVALLDTGVATSPDFGDRVAIGPDLSGEGDGIDRYGHGTFMAGLIVGSETGVAPAAHLVSVKVAGRDGSTMLSTVLDGLDWIVQTRDEFDTRIVSISLAVDPFAVASIDPLAIAVEFLTARGMLVVAASGNTAGMVAAPGIAPSALTVGATVHNDTASTSDDVVAAWSGANGTKPEVVAPGAAIISVRAPGSTIDTVFPGARVGDRRFRGSGTSMATALTAGAAAVVAEQAPDATPSELKSMLVRGARAIAGGAKTVDLRGSEKIAAETVVVDTTLVGTGVTGTITWTGSRWAGSRWAGTAWSGSRWAGSRWAGSRWAGSRWAGSTWSGSRWAGSRWAGSRWAGSRWAASEFVSTP